MNDISTIGFIGLGVMGEPICRNLAVKSGIPVTAFDLAAEPLQRLAAQGVTAANTVADTAGADLVFLSLPGGDEVAALCNDSLLDAMRPGAMLVDLGTTQVGLTRDLAARFAEREIAYADAPVARTRAAAEAGTLSIMVGADAAGFARIEPLLRHCASEITHCGPVGSGQVVKLMNNMVLVQTVAALAEALATGRRAGVDGKVLFETLSKGSADSFALRNHGMNALLPGEFPERAFPASYMLKDLSYAILLAQENGLDLDGAGLTGRRLEETIAAGFGSNYFPAMLNVIDRDG